MKRWIVLIYAIGCYAGFLAISLYLAGWLGNLVVPQSIDQTGSRPGQLAVFINLLLVALFAVQHSVMARPKFKKWWTRIIPKPVERSTYVLCTNLVLLALFWQWQPMEGIVWDLNLPLARAAVYGLYIAGWLTVLVTTFLINHFDLFGLRQAWLYFRRRAYTPVPFATPGPYRWVRHPLYIGWFLAIWAAPTMTAGHLLFACGMTVYVMIAIRFEERNLLTFYGPRYATYRRNTPMLIPFVTSVRTEQGQAAAAERPGITKWKQAITNLFTLVLLSIMLIAGCGRSGIHTSSHGWSAQDAPLGCGKLISFSKLEKTSANSPRQSLCHVWLIYPEGDTGAKPILGSGQASSGGDVPYYRVHWRFREKGDLREKQVELQLDMGSQRLSIEGQTVQRAISDPQEPTTMSPVVERTTPGKQPFSLNSSNLFLVTLTPEYDIAQIHQGDSYITGMASKDDLWRLQQNAREMQAMTASVKTMSISEVRDQARSTGLLSQSASRPERFEQTKKGVTVRLEKVTVERIYHVRGFLDRHYPKDRQEKQAVRRMLERSGESPLRLVRIFFSYTGPVQRIGVNVTHPRFEQRIGGEVHISNTFQDRLQHIALEEDMSGAEIYAVVPEMVDMDEVFPCDVRVAITTQDGDEPTFHFSDVM
jgi:protein-S-isoprenylcysteine O-methyltransferase Ste14